MSYFLRKRYLRHRSGHDVVWCKSIAKFRSVTWRMFCHVKQWKSLRRR